MTGIEALLLSSIVAASPTTPTPWFLEVDYPVRAFQRRQEGATEFEVLVSPDGQPAKCTITRSSSHYMLDERACLVAMQRIRFAPAKAPDGSPSYGVYKSRVNWALDPDNWTQSEVGPDFELSLNKLPDNVDGPVSIKYAVLVDSTGKAVDCNAITTGFGAVLSDLGCTKIKQDYRHVALAKSGATVPAVQTAWITFTQ